MGNVDTASAAIMLREMISGKTSPFEEIFRPEKLSSTKLITKSWDGQHSFKNS